MSCVAVFSVTVTSRERGRWMWWAVQGWGVEREREVALCNELAGIWQPI